MAAAALIKFFVQVTGLANRGDIRGTAPDQTLSTSVIGKSEEVTLTQNAETTITAPTGAVYVLFTPPTTNTQAIQWRANTTVAGPTIHPSKPSQIALPSGTTTMLMHLAAGSNQVIGLVWAGGT